MVEIKVVEPVPVNGFQDSKGKVWSNLQDCKISNAETALLDFIKKNLIYAPEPYHVFLMLQQHGDAVVQILSDINAARAAKD